MIQVQGFLKQQVIASGEQKHPVVGRITGPGFSIVEDVRFQPLFHETPGKEPLAGHLCSRQSLFVDKGIYHLVVDMQEFGDFFGRKKLSALYSVHKYPLSLNVRRCLPNHLFFYHYDENSYL